MYVTEMWPHWPDERTREELARDEAEEKQCQLADLGFYDPIGEN